VQSAIQLGLQQKSHEGIQHQTVTCKQVKALHLDERYVRSLSQTPTEKIWWNHVWDWMFKFLGCVMHVDLESFSIGGRICCELRAFRFCCNSRSHKRSKCNSVCGLTFSPSCALRSAGGYIDSLKIWPCAINLSLISDIVCVTWNTADFGIFCDLMNKFMVWPHCTASLERIFSHDENVNAKTSSLKPRLLRKSSWQNKYCQEACKMAIGHLSLNCSERCH